ncbi:MAG: Xaa-Pro peptidase family protein [Thaumarchaeota archaeon]|nr:aminopeptidase P family protein [Nitrososphaerota archaeon]MCS4540406.1 Xaa-Pro peptidase family protein [Nitrososphaerota archaeon]
MATKNSPRERREVLAQFLANGGLDAALISNPKHIFYFTGFPSNLNMYLTLMKGPRSTSFLLIDNEAKGHLLLGGFEVSNPWVGKKSTSKRIFDGEVTVYNDYDLDETMIAYPNYLSHHLAKWIKDARREGVRLGRVGIEHWHLAEIYRDTIRRAADSTLEWVSEEILRMRRTKGRDEIDNLKKATHMIDYAYEFAKRNARAGRSELDIYREMNYRTFAKYGPFGWIIGDHVSGERSLAVGGWATPRRFRKTDTIVLDLQAAHKNYWSDLCRTFVVGKPSKKQERAHDVLIKAKERAEETLEPGTKGREIYEAVTGEIERAGYPRLPHHAGHTIGLDDQERPWMIPGEDEELEEGMVCVVEPGIYTSQTGGIRIEDCYVITKTGHERVSRFPLGLT